MLGTIPILLIKQTLLLNFIDLQGFYFSYSFKKGPECPDDAREQMEWLQNELSTSTADYIVVGGHYPVWSIGNHGPTKQLLEELKPMFEKYRVTSYLCGHDHNLQVIETNLQISFRKTNSLVTRFLTFFHFVVKYGTPISDITMFAYLSCNIWLRNFLPRWGLTPS